MKSEKLSNKSRSNLYLVHLLLKNLKFIVISTSILVFLVLIITIIGLKLPPKISFMPNLYSPKSLVIVNLQSSGNSLNSLLGGSSDMGSLASLAGLPSSSSSSDADLAIKLGHTNTFLQKIIDKFDLFTVYDVKDSAFPKTELRNILRDNLRISLDENSGLLEFTYTDIDKVLATEIVNTATQLMEEEFKKIDSIRNKDQYQIIEEQKSIVFNEITRLEEEILSFQNRYNIMDVEAVSVKLLSQLIDLQTQLLEKDIEIDSYQKVSNVKDPGYNRLLSERDAIINAMNRIESGSSNDLPAIKDLPKLSLELNHLESELKIQTVVYTNLITQSEALKLTAGGAAATFQVLEKAEIPEKKSAPSRSKFVIFSCIAGFFFIILFVLLKEIIYKISNDEESMKVLKGEL